MGFLATTSLLRPTIKNHHGKDPEVDQGTEKGVDQGRENVNKGQHREKDPEGSRELQPELVLGVATAAAAAEAAKVVEGSRQCIGTYHLQVLNI